MKTYILCFLTRVYSANWIFSCTRYLGTLSFCTQSEEDALRFFRKICPNVKLDSDPSFKKWIDTCVVKEKQ